MRHLAYNTEENIPLRKPKLLHPPAQRQEVQEKGLLPKEPVAFDIPLAEDRQCAKVMGSLAEPALIWLDKTVQTAPSSAEVASS